MDEYEGLTPAEYEADRARARQIRFRDLPVHIQRNILRLREPGAFRELFKGASNDGEAGEFLTRYIAEMPVEYLRGEAIAQVTPKNLGYGFEADMGGTFGGGDGVYIRGTFPEERNYRDRQYEQMKERMGNPFRGASRGSDKETVAQLAPRSVRNAVSPSDLPYIQTPTERRADEMLMQRLGKDLSEDDMRFFLEGNYGFRGV